jgi:putative Holliday junction resolvase
MKRIIGLDVGEKTIGLARSDLLGITAQGVKTIIRSDLDEDLNELVKFIKENEVELVVIGLPKNMNNTIGPSAKRAKEFGENLSKKINVDIKYWDERLSTAAAARTLLDADISRKKRKKVIDKMAAVLILQNYLDSIN